MVKTYFATLQSKNRAKKKFIVTEKAIWGKKWKDTITTIKQKEIFSRGIKVGDPERVRRGHPARLSSWQRGVIAYINGTIASLLVLFQRVQTNTNLFTAKGSTCSFKRDDCGCNEKTDDGHDDALHGLISMASFFPLKPSGYIIVDFLCNFWLSSTINCRIKSSKHDPRQKKWSTI